LYLSVAVGDDGAEIKLAFAQHESTSFAEGRPNLVEKTMGYYEQGEREDDE
jgi:hypothetical protein